VKKLNLAVLVAAGFLGGMFSHFVWAPTLSHAQSPEAAPKEVRAQSFVLVDDEGKVEGIFSFDEPQGAYPSSVKLLDSKGHEVWKVGGSGLLSVAKPK